MKSLNSVGVILPIIIGLCVGFLMDSVAIGIAVFAALLMPALVAVYIPYAKDNPDHLWFKRKLYGWGWTPVTWQGWMVTLVYIGLVIAFALTIDDSSAAQEVMFTFILPVVFLTLAFMKVAYKKGEAPRFQWGVRKEETGDDNGR